MGDVAKVSKLAELGSPLDQLGRLEASPLHIAAEHDRAEAATWLLKSAGAGTESADKFGSTPLMIACERDSVRTVELLLDTGAAIEANGKRAINEARSEKVMRLLTEKGGADVNCIDDCGNWPLEVAAAANDTSCVDWLIAHGALVDLTSTGATALHTAIRADAREAAQLLLQHGANPNAQDVDGCTPLFETQSREAIQLLLNHGADPKITDQCGYLPKSMRADEDPLLKELLLV
jgi:ankyrin repeat protein